MATKEQESFWTSMVFVAIFICAILAWIYVSIFEPSAPPDTTSESFRVQQRDRMIQNGAKPADAEEFTKTLTDMEKEWKRTGKVSP